MVVVKTVAVVAINMLTILIKICRTIIGRERRLVVIMVGITATAVTSTSFASSGVWISTNSILQQFTNLSFVHVAVVTLSCL